MKNENSKYEFQPDVFVMCDGKTKGVKLDFNYISDTYNIGSNYN
ncbi:hypothetical protein [Clostridium beijerinckii]|nr:hypothetical protein [Clostridium beijerinckii]NOW83409.1 hypothetical protein [Clostridium beijerinckii]